MTEATRSDLQDIRAAVRALCERYGEDYLAQLDVEGGFREICRRGGEIQLPDSAHSRAYGRTGHDPARLAPNCGEERLDDISSDCHRGPLLAVGRSPGGGRPDMQNPPMLCVDLVRPVARIGGIMACAPGTLRCFPRLSDIGSPVVAFLAFSLLHDSARQVTGAEAGT